jgi:hypothetical protein
LSQHQRELKSLFVLSSHGSKSPKLKLKDCLTLFEVLYEKEPEIRTKLDELIQTKQFESIKKFEFNFDLYKLDYETNSEKISLAIFLNRLATIRMLLCEEAELKRQGYEKYWIFDVWRGNLTKLVNEMDSKKALNDFLVLLHQLAIDPSESRSSLVNSYIQQMQKGGLEQINKSVLIALASYNIEQAIHIYISQNMFPYALCLAQVRLGPNNQLFYEVLESYASFSAHNGDYESAAMCFIRLSDFENAFKILNRRDAKNDADTEQLIKCLLEKLGRLLPN